MAKDVSVGIIQEQGDLGIFTPLNESDAKVYAEATNKSEAANTEVINEESK